MREFRKLDVWKRSMSLAQACYRASEGLPASEGYGLVSQLRRSAVFVPSNIAEGSGRGSPRDLVRFLNIAYGSACELGTQALLAQRLAFGNPDLLVSVAAEVRWMIHALMNRVLTDDASVPVG